jgi:type IV pilus assembly protein PilA
MNKHAQGFTMIELMVVIGIVAILATLAAPSYQAKIVRDQIVEGATLASTAKTPVAAAWLAAGLPVADKIVSTYISSVVVEGGAIHLTYGNQANGAIKGKILTLRPAVVEDAPIVPVSWVCGHASAPDKMTAKGQDRTNIPPVYLPFNCKAR